MKPSSIILLPVLRVILFMTLCKEYDCAQNRVYYIAIREEIWDYAPSGIDQTTGMNLTENPDAKVFMTNGRDRIGRKYKKAIYRQYTDRTFTTEIPKDPSMGFLGPTLTAEVGDNVTIYAFNFAAYNFSLHPHGELYTKLNEGALYAGYKPTQIMQPGTSATYLWEARPEYGPTADDPECITWAYHSHVNAEVDVYSGLVGALLVCNPGTLDSSGKRKDVDKNFVLLFMVVDEGNSWYINDNIETFCAEPASVDLDDDDFVESNLMHSINGLSYGNLDGLSACHGESIAWNIFGMGNEVDIHSVHFEKQTVVSSGHREDTVSLFPATFSALQMNADNAGTSLVACMLNDHYTAGMKTTFFVNDSCGDGGSGGVSGAPAKTFYVGIVEEYWNYGPSGKNVLTGQNLTAEGTDSSTFFTTGPDRIGGTYRKALFKEYNSENFTDEVAKESTFGILGPLIAVEVGDVIDVTLKNFANKTYNIEPHGLSYQDISDVGPGETHTYTWTVPENVAPTTLDNDCITYLYTSSVDPVKDTNSGLVGPLLVCKKGTLANAMGRSKYFLMFTVFDENSSNYLEENIQRFATDPGSVDPEDEDFEESNLMHSINGLMYGNLLGIDLCARRDTDFHVIGLGSEVDMHSMFATGLNIRVRGENTAVVSVFAHTTSSTTLNPEQTGSGQIRCAVIDHLVGGMLTSFQVKECGGKAEDPTESGEVDRIYFIAAVEEIYDANPSGIDYFGNPVDDPNNPAYTFTHQEDGKFIGSKYKKAIYYEYTDETFSKRKDKRIDLGMLGPVISAEEGERIKVVFKNKATFPYSMSPGGAMDEANPLNPGAEVAQPDQTVTYYWKVPASAVPPQGQPACQSWMYMSTVDMVKDVYSGLIGPLLICREGTLTSEGRTAGVDEEFFLLFLVIDENNSNYLDDNIERYLTVDLAIFDKEDPDFVESNLMHGINGQLYKLPGLDMTVNDTVLWHLMGYGNEVDIHTVHFHAHGYTYINDRTEHSDVFKLFPGKIGTVTMYPTEVGEWLMHCHVNDHIQSGMVTTYRVAEKKNGSARPILLSSYLLLPAIQVLGFWHF